MMHPPSANEGRVLFHALGIIDGLQPTHFKIGITQDPAHRWGDPDFGYAHHRESGTQMTNMIVIYAAADPHATAMLEASLIALCTQKYPTRCLNKALGGESKTSSPVHFCYIVYG